MTKEHLKKMQEGRKAAYASRKSLQATEAVEEVRKKWPDGHELKNDTNGWIVCHPVSCKNVSGRNTFYGFEHGAMSEIRKCGL